MSDYQLRNEYSMCIIRTVNGLTDMDQKSTVTPVFAIADNIKLPAILVDIRHRASHQDLPSISICRQGCIMILSYMENAYFSCQMDIINAVRVTPLHRAESVKSILCFFANGLEAAFNQADLSKKQKDCVNDTTWSSMISEILVSKIEARISQYVTSPEYDGAALVSSIVCGVLMGYDTNSTIQNEYRQVAYWSIIIRLLIQKLPAALGAVFFATLVKAMITPVASVTSSVNPLLADEWCVHGEDPRGPSLTSLSSNFEGHHNNKKSLGDISNLFPSVFSLSAKIFGPIHRRLSPQPPLPFPSSSSELRRRAYGWLVAILDPVNFHMMCDARKVIKMIVAACEKEGNSDAHKIFSQKLTASIFKTRGVFQAATFTSPLVQAAVQSIGKGEINTNKVDTLQSMLDLLELRLLISKSDFDEDYTNLRTLGTCLTSFILRRSEEMEEKKKSKQLKQGQKQVINIEDEEDAAKRSKIDSDMAVLHMNQIKIVSKLQSSLENSNNLVSTMRRCRAVRAVLTTPLLSTDGSIWDASRAHAGFAMHLGMDDTAQMKEQSFLKTQPPDWAAVFPSKATAKKDELMTIDLDGEDQDFEIDEQFLLKSNSDSDSNWNQWNLAYKAALSVLSVQQSGIIGQEMDTIVDTFNDEKNLDEDNIQISWTMITENF